MVAHAKCDYILNAGHSTAHMSPIARFETLGSAIEYAETLLNGARCPVEVVYTPEDNKDASIVLYRNEMGGLRPCIFIAVEEIIKLKIQKEVSE